MLKHLLACLWLLVVTVVLCCVVYPLMLLGTGKYIFPQQAEGSLIERDGITVGSKLIGQPFSDEKYFQSRPSAASYDASNSGATNWAGNNYLLRDRVAQQLGPIVRYAGGAKKGDLVGPDIENWFKANRFRDKTGIVAQWVGLHGAVAQNWIKGDTVNSAYVADWQKSHGKEVANWIKDNPSTPEPKPEDLASPFFEDFSSAHPGTFLKKAADGKSLELTTSGDEIRKTFFDMWLIDHPEADLQKVPADMVMASGSGLDPHITRENALWQLDHFPIASAWAKSSGKDEATVRADLRKLIQEKSDAPWGGLIGVPLVNVVELNLAVESLFHRSGTTDKL